MRRHVDRELARGRVKGAKRYSSGVRTDLAPLTRSIIDAVARTKEGEKLRFENAVPPSLFIPIGRTDLAKPLREADRSDLCRSWGNFDRRRWPGHCGRRLVQGPGA